jgi:isopentenyldiphosphate isomerase
VVAAREPVEELGRAGRVAGVSARGEIRRRNLHHRAVYVMVLDGEDRLLVHRRAGWKYVWPGRWDVAFGGVATVGETAIDTARRELAEEAGGQAVLEHLGAGHYEDDEVRVVGDGFRARSDGPCTFADGEVVETAWVGREDLTSWLETHSTCPEGIAIALPLLLGRPAAY